eukprot:SAG31_NODE_307_length_17957_cov_5.236645_7_plen_106_part_00
MQWSARTPFQKLLEKFVQFFSLPTVIMCIKVSANSAPAELGPSFHIYTDHGTREGMHHDSMALKLEFSIQRCEHDAGCLVFGAQNPRRFAHELRAVPNYFASQLD